MSRSRAISISFVVIAALMTCAVGAQTTYSDNFSGTKANLKWTALDDACLTAGDGNGSIPSCAENGISVGADEKVPGQGALLLTPATNMQTGAILSAFPPFPLSQGIQITFTTYTFGGDSGGTAKNGADGIVFFLTDGTKDPPTTTGGEGGSMGYGCSNGNDKADGIAYGYLGLGIDEFGNFLNSGDNGSVGIYNSNNKEHGTTVHGTNSYSSNVNGSIGAGTGPQYQPERIGLRGAGNTNWAWLKSKNSDYYSGSYDKDKVQWACKNGKYVSGAKRYWHNGHWNYEYTYDSIPYNYNAIPGGYSILPDDKPDQPIANNSKNATRNPTATTPQADIAWPITYRLTISSKGYLNFAYSYNNGAFLPVLVNTDITKSNGPLPASLRFGFSAGTGGSNNVHEITCFKASPLQANSSAGSNTVTGKVTGNTQFFFASYSSDSWWGSLVADPLIIQNNGDLNIGTDANWDAKCVLTGGSCGTMGTDASGNPEHNVAVQSPSTRNLVTWDGDGVNLKWNDLSSAVQTILNQNPSGKEDDQGETRVDWLRGVRSGEQLQDPPGTLRARQYVLGDIINSSPTFVGAPFPNLFPDTFVDLTNSTVTIPENDAGAQKYSQFVSNNVTRQNVVYVGSNDGFLHGFRAGKYDSAGIFDDTTNDGHELLGYMPHGVLLNKVVNLADPLYKHAHLVDATPVAGSVFYNDDWHTWLVGGVGSQGQEMYALDITDPTGFTANDVLGDWDSSTLPHLGNTVGTPIIARMHNGDWAFIFGSGLRKNNDGTINANGATAGVYIGLINSGNGSISFQFLDTGVGSASDPDGIAYVSAADLDGDHIADYLYAGDTQGNVWRFDVTGSTATDWKASTFGNAKPTPLFVAKDAQGTRQPITTSIVPYPLHVGGQKYREMLYFGTGRETPQTLTRSVQYAKGEQTFYGIWDWDMDAWSSLTSSSLIYASLTGPQSITRDDLLQQTVVAETADSSGGQVEGYRTLSTQKVVCWEGDSAGLGTGTSSDCTTFDQYGWLFTLPGKGPDSGSNAGSDEQIIYNPTSTNGAIIVNTAIPPLVSALQCNPGLQSGWTMAFNPATGGGFTEGFFAGPNGSFGGGDATNGGVKMNGVGKISTVKHDGKTYLVTQTITGGGKLIEINPPQPPSQNVNQARVSWRELVN